MVKFLAVFDAITQTMHSNIRVNKVNKQYDLTNQKFQFCRLLKSRPYARLIKGV